MKVCFLAGTLGRGGAERQLIYMLRALKQAGILTRVLCLTKGEANEQEIRNLGVEIEWVGDTDNRGMRLLKIAGNLRKNPVDIVQSAHFYTNLYVGAVSRCLNIISIGAIRNDLISELRIQKHWAKLQLFSPKHLIANSEIARSRAIERGIRESRIDFVPNVVDINGGSFSFENKKEALKILFAGRLVNEKRPELFIKLAAALKQTLPNASIKFQIAGDGPLRPQLEMTAKNLGLLKDDFLSFFGSCSDMDQTYQQADMLILTSQYEGTPNVVLEAMAHGLPVIATRVGGVPEILKDNCGIVFDPADWESLVASTIKLISNRELRSNLGRNGSLYVQNNHSLESLKNRLIGIYSKLLTA